MSAKHALCAARNARESINQAWGALDESGDAADKDEISGHLKQSRKELQKAVDKLRGTPGGKRSFSGRHRNSSGSGRHHQAGQGSPQVDWPADLPAGSQPGNSVDLTAGSPVALTAQAYVPKIIPKAGGPPCVKRPEDYYYTWGTRSMPVGMPKEDINLLQERIEATKQALAIASGRREVATPHPKILPSSSKAGPMAAASASSVGQWTSEEQRQWNTRPWAKEPVVVDSSGSDLD
jgi:hypothetical protein